jgi:Integrase core domain
MAPFDKIHMDLKEFSVQSYIQYKFFILFFDNYTSFSWIVLLRRKSEADSAIRQFIAMVKNQFNKVIHEFIIDAGGEFKSNKLRTFLKKLGINILTSVLHMHQQNGRAKRFIRTIVEKAQAIRLEACISQNWWEFAVNYTVHVYNCTPLKRSSNDYKTPFKRLHHTKPDVAHLRVFGCRAYVFFPEDMRSNNLSPCIPVGPAGGQVPWQHMQPQQPSLQPPLQQRAPTQPPPYSGPPLPPSSPTSSRHSSGNLSYQDSHPLTPKDSILSTLGEGYFETAAGPPRPAQPS